jgi:hypothetical protein
MLIRFTNKNKHGNLRHRVMYKPDNGRFKINPNGFGSFISVKQFKYEYNHKLLPPALFTSSDGKTYIVPTWKEVLPETTLNDITWVRDVKVKKVKPKKDTWEFKSSSSDSVYTVTQVGLTYKCTCPGFFRAKDRKKGCKHVQEVNNK